MFVWAVGGLDKKALPSQSLASCALVEVDVRKYPHLKLAERNRCSDAESCERMGCST